jgi:predicted nucleotidyltransferase
MAVSLPLSETGSARAAAWRPRLEFPFTCRDSAALREAVERDLQKAVDILVENDPGLWSIVLTGGFARGEGTALGNVPANDYDLLIVRRAQPIPPGLYSTLGDELAAACSIPFDIKPVWKGRLGHVAPKIFWYETREAGRTVAGPEVRDRIRPIRSDEIPLSEGIRLLANRAAGLVEVASATGEVRPEALVLQARKAQLACGEALLLARRAYHWSLRERARRLSTLEFPPSLLPAVRRAIEAAEWKLDPTAVPSPNPEDLWESAKHDLLAVFDVTSNMPGALRRDPLHERITLGFRSHRILRPPRTSDVYQAGLEILRVLQNAHPSANASFEPAWQLLGRFRQGKETLDATFAAVQEELFRARSRAFP